MQDLSSWPYVTPGVLQEKGCSKKNSYTNSNQHISNRYSDGLGQHFQWSQMSWHKHVGSSDNNIMLSLNFKSCKFPHSLWVNGRSYNLSSPNHRSERNPGKWVQTQDRSIWNEIKQQQACGTCTRIYSETWPNQKKMPTSPLLRWQQRSRVSLNSSPHKDHNWYLLWSFKCIEYIVALHLGAFQGIIFLSIENVIVILINMYNRIYHN